MAAEEPAPLWPYATAGDLRARWPDMPDGDDPMAGVLLEDASAMLDAMEPFDGAVPGELTEPQRAALRAVTCEMVRAAMASASDGDGFGAGQLTVTAGPYSQTATYQGAAGSLFVTKAQRRRLGIDQPDAGWATPWGGPDD